MFNHWHVALLRIHLDDVGTRAGDLVLCNAGGVEPGMCISVSNFSLTLTVHFTFISGLKQFTIENKLK